MQEEAAWALCCFASTGCTNDVITSLQEEAALAFALVYAALDEVLPRMEELRALACRDGSKADREAARARLARIIKVPHPNSPHPFMHSAICTRRV